jgi:hypothetical protein
MGKLHMIKTAAEDDLGKQILDVLSVATVVGALMEMLPSIAALFTILWTGLRIWETDTVRGWTGRKNQE